VIFVPKWPKGEFLVCNWPLSVGQNHFFVMMLLNRDFAIQSASKRFCTVYKSENSIPCQLSGRPSVHSNFRPDDENFPSGPSSVSRSFELFLLASVRTFSVARPDDTQCSTSYGISFQNIDMGSSLQPFG
jgi:hypothetical protein